MAAQVSLEEAKSNISTWLPDGLVDAVPSLQMPGADKTATVVGGILLLVSVAIWVIFRLRRPGVDSAHKMETAMPEDKKEELGELHIDNRNGGIGAEVKVDGGSATGPVTGIEAGGARIVQTGPGVGMKLTVSSNGSAPVTGMRIVKTIQGD